MRNSVCTIVGDEFGSSALGVGRSGLIARRGHLPGPSGFRADARNGYRFAYAVEGKHPVEPVLTGRRGGGGRRGACLAADKATRELDRLSDKLKAAAAKVKRTAS